MKISKPQINQKNNHFYYQVDVEYVKGKQTLWYSLSEEFGDLISNTNDAALVALLLPAMANGEDIHIEGKVSKRLLFNLSRPLQKVLQLVIPSLRPIKMYADEVISNSGNQANGVATGFSGGVDSFCVLADHYYSENTEKYNISHLLFNSVGSMASGGEEEFLKRYKRLQTVTEQIGLPFVLTTSNLNEFYRRDKLNFLQTHTLRDASVALLLQGGIGNFMYASSYSYPEAFVGPNKTISYSDAITLPLLSTENLNAFSVGSEYTRVEKIQRVAEIPDSYNALDVCVNSVYTGRYTNCGTCWKCLRTLSALEIGGMLDRYSFSFDLDAYKGKRIEYFAELLASKIPIQQEIVRFSRQREFSFPVSSHLMHTLRIGPVKRLRRRGMRKLKRLKSA